MPTMWDRLRPNAATQKDGDVPVLSRRKLEDWQNSRFNQQQQQQHQHHQQESKGYSYSITGGTKPARPPRDFEYSTETREYQTSAPAVQAPPPPQAGRNSYRSSQYGRPASSIYSQPSPLAATFAAQQLRGEVYSDPHEISPPSSPDIAAPRNGPKPTNAGDVSPIDDAADKLPYAMDHAAPDRTDPTRSNIPMMRRERRKNSDAAQHALRMSKSKEVLKPARPHGNDVRWDSLTGEPTSSTEGRPSQVNPQLVVQGLGKAPVPPLAPVTGPQSNRLFGERVRRTAPPPRQSSTSPQAESAPRPEWRGASGRTAIVAPVSDSRAVPPLNIPRKSSKRAPRGGRGDQRTMGVLSPVSSLGSETGSPPPHHDTPVSSGAGTNSTARSAQAPSASTIRSVAPSGTMVPSSSNSNPASAQSAYPSPPLPDESYTPAKHVNANQRAPQPPAHSQPQQSTLFPPTDKAIRRKPAGGSAAGHNPHISTSSSVYSQPDIHPAQAPPGAFPEDWTQPPSRFSVTTYATSAHTSSPRPSVDDDAPPLPTTPHRFAESPKSTPGSNSVLDRKRPVVSGYDHLPRTNRVPSEPIKVNMDSPYYMSSPLGSSTRPAGPRAHPSNASVMSVASLDKTLPPAPPEESARDRVTQLNAKLQSLGNRRININQAIKQMTELMPTDYILASDEVVRKREAEKRKVETLRSELAEVQREEYELGLKLHRAYKRMDRDADYEPTTLWVRRVTGRE